MARGAIAFLNYFARPGTSSFSVQASSCDFHAAHSVFSPLDESARKQSADMFAVQKKSPRAGRKNQHHQ